jgi:subtilisin family serine protease
VTGPAEGEIELQLTVDEDLAPALSHVGALDDGGLDRPVGRIKYDDDTTADLVLGELIVAVESDDELKGFLERNQGLVLDSFPGEEGELDEYLVRIPVRDADPAVAARALTEAEEGHTGEYAVSDSQLLAMMLVAAEEKLEFGIDVALNWISTVAGIADGKVEDAFDQKNPFDWGYLKVGGPVDSGVSGAWQLIDYYQKDDAEVRILIADGGFFENPDFPFQREIRLGKWNTKNPGSCTGGAACPWHGTSVAVTAMGQIDNGYGTAGVAGQVGIMIAVQKHGDFWTELRQIKKVVDEERPAVVNMSFGWEVKTFRAASESSTDRHLKAMKSDGALVFASAGNEGKDIDSKVCIGKHCYENRLTIPCESRYAICVGGYDGNGWLHTSSNYGPSGGGRSVQIYAPYCVIAPYNPVNNGIKDTKWTCGTSFSSPFVAGAAALVKAADPSLGPDQIWEIIRSTANVGGVQFDHLIPTHNQLRVNVMDAVAKALGVQQTAPVVEISAPANGFETGITDWFDLEGSAIDFKGQPLEITWESSIDGVLGTGLDAQAFFEPSAGTHTITATATDVNGKSGSASITVQVVDLPPEMTISWPASGSLVYETEDLNLIGLSEDPDTYSNLPDEDVEWKVVRNGQVKYAASGHIAEVPGGTLTPGHYEVVFTGQDGGGESEAVVNIAVLEVVGHVPSVLITSNLKESYGYSGGSGVELTLTGFASDFEDGTLPGTSFRWLLTTDGGAYQEEICRGSTFHGADDPGDGAFNPGLVLTPPAGPALPPVFGTKKDCSEVTINLGLAPGHVGETQWAIVLEASDSDHQPGSDVADVRITFAVG